MTERTPAGVGLYLEEIDSRRPAWLRDLRRAASQLAGRLSWPDRSSEDWRFTRWQELVPPEWTGDEEERARNYHAPRLDLTSLAPGAQELWRSNGVAVLAERRETALSVHGIVAEDVPEPVQLWLASALEKGKDRFDALALATLTDGAWLEIGEGASLTEPVVLRRSPGDKPWTSSISRIRLGKRSRGTVVILDCNEATTGSRYGIDQLEIALEERAEWTIVFVQALAGDVRRLQRNRIVLNEGALGSVYRVDLGGAVMKSENILRLLGKGAQALFRGSVVLGGDQHVEIDTLQDHVAGSSRSDLLVKSVVGDEARAVYRGRIWIHPGAQRTDAYQANRNLLLSRRAHVHSIPMLDIEANDVRCTHGSATGPIDEGQIFYLRTRGLSEAEARWLIVQGFVAEVLEGLSSDRAITVLEDALNQKLAAIL